MARSQPGRILCISYSQGEELRLWTSRDDRTATQTETPLYLGPRCVCQARGVDDDAPSLLTNAAPSLRLLCPAIRIGQTDYGRGTFLISSFLSRARSSLRYFRVLLLRLLSRTDE